LASLRAAAVATLGALCIQDAQNSEDTLREPSRLYERISNAAQGLIGNDYPPTQGQALLAAQVDSQLATLLASDDELFGARLAGLNVLLKRDGLTPIQVKR